MRGVATADIVSRLGGGAVGRRFDGSVDWSPARFMFGHMAPRQVQFGLRFVF